MRVFIAGATGVLGRHVVGELTARGHEVTGLARSEANAATLGVLGAQPAPADLFDADDLARAAAGADIVMHLASAMPRQRHPRLCDWALNDRIRTEGTANLLDAARRVRARFYVQQSVVAVHGSAGDHWVDETSPLVPHRVQDSAVTMEQLVQESSKLHGLPAVILRGGEFYHRESDQTRRMVAALRVGKLPVFGMGDNFWSLVHVEDMAHACVLATEARPAGETFLVVDDEPVRARDLFTHIARATGGPKLRYLPPAVARVFAGSLTVELRTASLRCRNSKIKRQLGWQPRFPTYRDGFAEILGVPAGSAHRPASRRRAEGR